MICFQLGPVDVQNNTFKHLLDVDRFFDWGLQGIYNIFGEKVMFVSLCYFEINYIKINATKEDIFLIPEDNLDKLSYGVELRIMITV